MLALVSYVALADEKYVIFLEDGKIASHQTVSSKYLEKFKDDPSNPSNRPGAQVVDSLEGYEFVEKPTLQELEIERFLSLLDDDKIKEKIKKIKE